jgi:hypothetical protein
MSKFVKEYMEESYFPWLWTLSELVEIGFTNMFDISANRKNIYDT